MDTTPTGAHATVYEMLERVRSVYSEIAEDAGTTRVAEVPLQGIVTRPRENTGQGPH